MGIFDFGEGLFTGTGLRLGYVEFKLNSILIKLSAGYLFFFLVFLFTLSVLKLDTTPPWTDHRPAAEGWLILGRAFNLVFQGFLPAMARLICIAQHRSLVFSK